MLVNVTSKYVACQDCSSVCERESLWVGGWVLFTLLVYKKGQFKLTDVIADMT